MTALLLNKLDPVHRPNYRRGSYELVLPYIQAAFADAMQEFSEQIPTAFRAKVTLIVSQLCQPDPKLRGDPANRRNYAGLFGLDRYVSALDLLAFHAEVQLKKPMVY